MEHITLEQIVRQHISLPQRPNGQGWYSVLCKVCNDHGKKGKRAGFRFDGHTVGYNCFNCGHTAMFDSSTHQTLSRDMVATLEAFGLKKEDWQPVMLSLMAGLPVISHQKKNAQYEPTPIEMPSFITPLDSSGDDFDLYAIEYLKDERAIQWDAYPFYIGRKSDNPSSQRWYGRLIIPFFKDDNLIFFQGRDLTDVRQKKYLSPDISRENVLYGYNRLFEETDEPLYIVEGWFDAWHLEGVAILGNKMTQHQIHWLSQSRRPKIVIPDRFGDGHLLGEQAIDLGWSVSTPDIGECKDPNEAIMKYGKIYTLMSIRNHTYSDFEASVRLKFYCEEKKNDARQSSNIRKRTRKKQG